MWEAATAGPGHRGVLGCIMSSGPVWATQRPATKPMVKRVERAAEAASREEMGHHSQKVGISSLHGGVLSQEDLHSKVLALIPQALPTCCGATHSTLVCPKESRAQINNLSVSTVARELPSTGYMAAWTVDIKGSKLSIVSLLCLLVSPCSPVLKF